MQNRIIKLKEKMAARGIAAFLVSKPENQFYLTGFRSTNCHLVITEDTNYLLTDFRYIEAAGELMPLYQVALIDDRVTHYTFLKDLEISELAIEEQYLSYADFKNLQEKVGCDFLSGDGIVEAIRAIKDKSECEAIERAQTIADKGFNYMLDYLKPGLTELEAAFELEMFLRREGAQGLSFDTILISGVRTSLPHGNPSSKKLEKGDFVTIDFGCVVDGYCSDMTRTVALGSITAEQREIYSIVLAAQKKGCDIIRAGLACCDVDKCCRESISEQGYGEFFGHGTGHGVGLEIHEAPVMNKRSRELLEEGMIVTVEPGIYLPQKFGVRIEDLAIVTASGIINLTKADKELIII